MTDPTTTSKSAREALARGLNALQADPSVPAQLVELAAPIAQAMGALHQLERTQQLAPHADVALNHVRGALAQLQAQPTSHPAVAQALEAVASSLSLVHALSRMANGPAPAQAAPAPAPAQPAQPAPAAHPKTAEMPQKPAAQAGPPQAAYAPPQQAAYAPPQQPMQPPPQQAAPQRMSNPQPSFPQGAPAAGGMVARDPFAAGPPPQQPPPGFHAAPPPQASAQARASVPVPSPPAAANVQLVNADLGAHSPTNFYKGLSGNDIIDHGGLFVSTYVLPKIGTPVRLKVSLPGGYEFEANAVVKWTREDGGGDAPPGFGAQFTGITPEARQLVYRYVRNREPLFHDDL
ncbi:MAG: PilZ domain-containing protein [Labilithrix sp.]|nr:PilZ domain-containing protein [Labilithrix sp.]